MLRASFLIIGLSSSCFSFLGDWKHWSPSYDARMGVVLNGTAWVATGGGILQWDLAGGSSRMHSRLDGLPTMDYASVVIDSQKTIWAIGSDGRIGYRPQSTNAWQVAESYATQNWKFSPRAAQFWKGSQGAGFLVLGTDHGVSIFSISQMVAQDGAAYFRNLTGTVLSVAVTPQLNRPKNSPPRDTLWVGLDVGLAFATPNWDSIGFAGHLLADPTQWTIKPTLTKNSRWTLYRTPDSMSLDTLHQWSDVNTGVSVQSGTIQSKQGILVVPGAVHAVFNPQSNKVLVSSSTQGPVLAEVGISGVIKPTKTENVFPDVAPVNVNIKLDGSWIVRSENRILAYDISTGWKADTIRFHDPDGTYEGAWAYTVDLLYKRKALEIGPQDEIIVPSWNSSYGTKTLGGFYVSNTTGNWTHFASTADDTCISFTETTWVINGAALLAARSFQNGTWLSVLSYTNLGRILFLNPGGKSPPTCFDIPKKNGGTVGNVVTFDFLQLGDTLWAATNTGLARIPSPRPSLVPSLQATTYHLPSNHTDLAISRITKIDFEGKTWIIGAATGKLILFPADGMVGSQTQSNLILSDSSAPSLNQSYTSLAIDAQNQIWAGGDKGLDIVQLVSPSAEGQAPSFSLVRHLTTADGLPNNQIYDLALQASTGKALIATASALALWTSPYRPVPARLSKSKIRVWPNPVRLRRDPNPDRTLFVDGATPGSQFDLLAADGTLVMHWNASKQIGGLFQIDLPPTSKLRPGLYFWSLKDQNQSVHGPLLIAE